MSAPGIIEAILNLENFISVKPPAFDVTISAQLGEVVSIDLGSENNLIPVSSTYMSGGWSTVGSGPTHGAIGSYGAYGGGVGVAGVVTYTALSVSAYFALAESARPKGDSFTYKVNDGTTDSDTKTVNIIYTGYDIGRKPAITPPA